MHQEKDGEWMEVNFPDFQTSEGIVLEKILLKDLGKLTEFCLTSQFKIINSLINKYSPKRQHFFKTNQYTCDQLGVLDHNIGTEHDYDRNSRGDVVTKFGIPNP